MIINTFLKNLIFLSRERAINVILNESEESDIFVSTTGLASRSFMIFEKNLVIAIAKILWLLAVWDMLTKLH